jgi:UDP-glucose 4-epimerase
VRSVVCLSTDKAVYPINAMGMTKALMEKTVQAFARNHPESRTIASVVRYGNVMYSRGSVIPLFDEQIRMGLPLTVTDPSMTRFLMTLTDSVHLVEHAFASAAAGDIFVMKAPSSTVGDLANAVARARNVPPDTRVIGTRHGEKLFETLLSREEMARAEDEGDYFRVPLDARSLDYALYFERGVPTATEFVDFNSQNTARLSEDEVVSLLKSLPQFAPSTDPGAPEGR